MRAFHIGQCSACFPGCRVWPFGISCAHGKAPGSKPCTSTRSAGPLWKQLIIFKVLPIILELFESLRRGVLFRCLLVSIDECVSTAVHH